MKPSESRRKDHLLIYEHEGELWFSSPDNGKNDSDFSWLHSKVSYGDSPLLTELERRGYDLSTLKFSVRLKKPSKKGE
jgi:hypothetical protein